MPSPARRTISDRALLKAFEVWGGSSNPPLWERFRSSWRESLEAAREEGPATFVGELSRAHAAEARPDAKHVHASWWIRALKDESPAVRRVVATHVDPNLRPILRRGLGLEPADFETD